jgi:hypothetical protein
MVSLARTLRNAYRSGFKQWWRFTYYIGDAKFGKLVGVDQCVLLLALSSRQETHGCSGLDTEINILKI